MRLRHLHLESQLFLSPLAGYTNLPFRLTVRQLGGLGLATTDLVNARSLLEQRPKALQLIATRPEDQPLAVQLFGAINEEMRDAAALLESRGIQMIDVNMGCPVPKVCRVGGGSAMMTDLDRTAQLVRGMVNAVQIPVTAKMRLGWDDANLTAPLLARALADVGVAAVFVHGRTRAQGFSGTVNLAGIRAVVSAVPDIPVIGNGDVRTPQAARRMLDETGCAGVSIGRGAFLNPWIFRHTQEYLHTGIVPRPPSFQERLAFMTRHLHRMIECFGETQGCRLFRKIAPWYARRFGPASFFNQRVVHIATREDYSQLLDAYVSWRAQFLDDQGHLRPHYQPPPLPTTLGEEPPHNSPTLPVPSGPVELW